jgi:hypothetical protein
MAETSDKKELGVRDSDAFEMIELAIDEVELLTKAFNLISDICYEMDYSNPCVEDEAGDIVIN